MTDLILKLLWMLPLFKKRYPNPHLYYGIFPSRKDLDDAAWHISFYMELGLFALLGMIFLSPWVGLFFPLAAIQILIEEFSWDGHYKRIKNGTETEMELVDLKTDLITRYAGLLIPAILAVFLIL